MEQVQESSQSSSYCGARFFVNASADMAMAGFGGIGAISSVQDIISITRTIRAAMLSLSVSFASWEKSVEDQQQLLAGKAFKAIPIQPANLALVQEAK